MFVKKGENGLEGLLNVQLQKITKRGKSVGDIITYRLILDLGL